MKHKILKTLIVLLILALTGASCLFYAIYISPENLKVEYHKIISSKIPESMNDVTIGYFSDVYYLEFMNEKRLNSMIEEMNRRDVDILLFGGDLFADPQNSAINADVISKLTKMLSSMDAPLGKFYVLGDRDKATADTQTLVSNILYNAGFENMENKNIKLHNGSKESITLVGLDNQVNGHVDVQNAFASTSAESFTLLFTHTPDAITLVPQGNANVAVAGHSLGGQIYLPLLGSMTQVEGAKKYNHGIYRAGKTNIFISNGLGTTGSDMRLFCPPQFTIFNLNQEKNKKIAILLSFYMP